MLAISSWENQAIGAKMLSLKKLKKFKKDCNNNKKKKQSTKINIQTTKVQRR